MHCHFSIFNIENTFLLNLYNFFLQRLPPYDFLYAVLAFNIISKLLSLGRGFGFVLKVVSGVPSAVHLAPGVAPLQLGLAGCPPWFCLVLVVVRLV